MMLLSEHAARITRDVAFGLHVGEQVEQRNYGVVGYAVITSETLGEALCSLVRYLPIWTNVGAFRLDIEGAVAHFRWEYANCSLPESRQDCEMTMATVARFKLLSSGGSWRPREVWFQHPKPKDTSEHARIFRAPVRFGMPANCILLDSKLLQMPLRKAGVHFRRDVIEAAEELLAKATGTESLTQSALSLIRQKLADGNFGVEAVSRHLGVSPRTMQRRLRDESSSYRKLIQQARQDLSEFLLLGAEATATETGYALGFSEPSAFLHAFHKWHGIPPQAYKKVHSCGS
jgi:AraC-like DNA-binding protein